MLHSNNSFGAILAMERDHYGGEYYDDYDTSCICGVCSKCGTSIYDDEEHYRVNGKWLCEKCYDDVMWEQEWEETA